MAESLVMAVGRGGEGWVSHALLVPLLHVEARILLVG